MSSYFIYYTEASVVCIIIFSIMLFRDVLSVDRQEKQIKYDHALIVFMLYFACDALWAAVIAGVIPKNRLTVLSTNFGNFVLMAAISYTWLVYVMAVEQVPERDSRLKLFAMRFPFHIATTALVASYILRPQVLLDENLDLQPGYRLFQLGLPCVYIAAILLYTMRRAIVEESPIERRRHLFIGFFPLMVVAGGMLQIFLLPDTPIFCFSCAILMIVFYINSMETQISTDPLTGLNNRGQLLHYTLQKSNLRREGRQTVAVMFDINDFKSINDTYGHAEGDRALLIVSEALKSVSKGRSMPMFLARYGGDEFILIAHPVDAGEIDAVIGEIRARIEENCRAEGVPYALSISAGYSRLSDGEDSYQLCLRRADENLYADKARQKGYRHAPAGW